MKLELLLMTAALALAGCKTTFETHDGTVESANEKLLAGKVDEARAGYDEAAKTLPESPALNYLKGLAASATGDHKAAHDLLLRALDTKDKALEQRIKAALGLAYAREALSLERTPAAAEPAPDAAPDGAKPETKAPNTALESWKLAVGFLEDALVMDPNDLESRRTLEVALLRVDPPCATRDDDLEQNDTRADAKLIEVAAEEPKASEANPQEAAPNKDVLRARKQLFSCPDDDDWFAFDFGAGDRVALGATVPKDAGELRFELFSPSGEKKATLSATGEKLDLVVDPSEAGRWTLSVVNVDLDEVSYGLEAVVRPACDKTEDTFEDNDSVAAAKTITPGPVPDLKSCPGDEDWYSLVLAEGESLFLYAQPSDPPSDEDKPKKAEGEKDVPPIPALEVEVLDESGAIRATGAPTGTARVSTLLTPGPGRYFVRVRGASAGFGKTGQDPFEGRYSLQVEVVPPCPEGDDRFEDNDIPEDATDFTKAATPEAPAGAPAQPQGGGQQGPPVIFARICPGDSDWWSFSSTGEKPEIITATFDHAQGDLDLVLYDERGQTEVSRSEASSATQNGEVIALPLDEELAKKKTQHKDGDPAEPPPPPKTWKLLVRGKEAAPATDGQPGSSGPSAAQNFYLLRLDQPSGGGGDGDGDSDESQQDEKNDEQKQDQNQDEQKQDEQKSPLQEALDKLDKNPENLPARDAAQKSPLANQKPIKDW